MDPALADIERACELTLGGGGDAATRAAAQARVMELGARLDAIPTLQALLDRSSSNFAVAAAALALQKLVTDHWNSFSEPQRVEIREFSRGKGGANASGLTRATRLAEAAAVRGSACCGDFCIRREWYGAVYIAECLAFAWLRCVLRCRGEGRRNARGRAQGGD
jgi:hypothetical protein